MSYQITHDYIKHGNARPGTPIKGPLFGVAHDTGNPGSTARQNRAYFNNQQPKASAQVFIDDKEILVIIPLNEKAYHVQYQKPYDNQRFGEDANDAGIGVELCWGGGINFAQAYNRYVWFWAWMCDKYGWDPHKKIASHKQLDPQRRTDPDNALNKHGITWTQFLNDVKKELNQFTKSAAPVLREGDQGNSVEFLQGNLNLLGYGLKIDGKFGPATKKAVMEFQRKSGLKIDGIVGAATIAKLAVALKKRDTKQVKVVIETNDINAQKLLKEFIEDRNYKKVYVEEI